MGQKNDLGSFLVGNNAFNYSMGSVFENVVVAFSANNANDSAKNSLPLVYELGF
jgi:hypothetical protein